MESYVYRDCRNEIFYVCDATDTLGLEYASRRAALRFSHELHYIIMPGEMFFCSADSIWNKFVILSS